MKTTAIAMLASITAMAAEDRKTVHSAAPEVIVCIEGSSGFSAAAEPSKWVAAEQSKSLASNMFTAIGVSIKWRGDHSDCPPQGILISLNTQTPPSLLPGALAYALPYEGTHICLFWDRIAKKNPPLLPYLLAHVLVHEISHILRGTRDHSSQGMMKARWTDDDFYYMMRKPLEFTSEELVQIRVGAAARTPH